MLPEVHGHRGCRGLMPENTVPAFLKAVDLGCEWLELDVVMTADGHVLVSHEPWMEHRICRTPSGEPIRAEQERGFNIHRMPLKDVQAFDCGLTRHPDFPEQRPQPAHKPTLAEVVNAVEGHVKERGLNAVGYNIEIKSEPALYGIFQPEPWPFAQAVLAAISALAIGDRCIIQSFDPAVLEAVHAIDPDLRTALLVDEGHGLAADLARLSFTPDFYSPDKALVDSALLASLRARNIGLLVWTVNDPAEMERFIHLGVDGIITDRPDRLMELLGAG
ncbi:MAG: glycerophosphodiester phosphodiesterase family protein [Flavobacteriales bacterium]